MNYLPHAEPLVDSICNGIIKLGMRPDALPVAAYVSYLELLNQWNKAYNLTAIHEPGKMVTHHVLDSLSVLPYVKGNNCIDIGTGAGLPGLILALATPEKEWVLLDSNQKKIRFLNQAIIDLNIKNVTTIKTRAEEYSPERLFTTIITRAFGKLALIISQTRHLLSTDGIILAMKGTVTGGELAGIDKNTHKIQLHELTVPGITDQRTLVEITPLPSTN